MAEGTADTGGEAAPTRERILEAAFNAVCVHGLGRLSLEDVAREAELSRQTVYRYFGGKQALVEAVVLREEEQFIERILAATDEHDDVRPALEAAILAALQAAREHPLLDRLLATEPEAMLPLLMTGNGPVLPAARTALEALFARRLPHLSAEEAWRVADATTRLFISYAINPPEDTSEAVAAGLADLILNGLKDPTNWDPTSTAGQTQGEHP
ncbi:MAG TPA: TetR/AcrR family transcriptional regulator [Egibacteraceae bacterium]|nr:TetR/AcrR family transcriptional regulator [Egibacteraceae bacterium]